MYVSATASDISKEKKRSKVNPEDVFGALNELGFQKYEDQLREFLQNYHTDKEDQAREKLARKRPAPEDHPLQVNYDEDHEMLGDGDDASSKRVKLEQSQQN